MKVKLFTFLIILFQIAYIDVQATTLICSTSGCKGVDEPTAPPPPLPGSPQSILNPFGCTAGLDCPNRGGSMSQLDTDLLNLKKDVSNARVSSINSAISITQTDFEGFIHAGKSIVFSQGFYDNFTMNIGVADAVNAQTWTLPSNLAEYVDGLTTRVDIISPSAVPAPLQIAGATHVLKRIESEPNGDEADNYTHLQIDGTEVTDLGTSYDFDEGGDDNFGTEPDVELYDVPLDLGDSQTTDEFPMDEVTNDNYLKTNTFTTVDAFGTINTPYGNFACLRQTEITKYFRRANGSASFGTTPNYEFRRVKWITKNGFIFSAAVQSENASHVGLLGFMELTRFVPTNTLTSQSAVKINNDSKGVSINNTDFVAHESAILDINSDSLGILIPRIAKANRPQNPTEGLLVYQVDETPGFYYYNGTGWRILSSTASARIAAPPAPEGGASTQLSDSKAPEASVAPSGAGGAGRLVAGSTFIKFDSPRDDFENVLINIQLEGDCNGIYISKKTREGFEVKELQKGKSNVKFSWKVD